MTEENKEQGEVKKEKRTQNKRNYKKGGEEQTRKRNHKKTEEMTNTPAISSVKEQKLQRLVCLQFLGLRVSCFDRRVDICPFGVQFYLNKTELSCKLHP